MLQFHLNISKSQRQAMEVAFAKARQRGDLRIMNRLLAIFAIAEGEKNLSQIARLLRVSHEAVRQWPVSYTHPRAHETRGNLVCRLLLE